MDNQGKLRKFWKTSSINFGEIEILINLIINKTCIILLGEI